MVALVLWRRVPYFATAVVVRGACGFLFGAFPASRLLAHVVVVAALHSLSGGFHALYALLLSWSAAVFSGVVCALLWHRLLCLRFGAAGRCPTSLGVLLCEAAWLSLGCAPRCLNRPLVGQNRLRHFLGG